MLSMLYLRTKAHEITIGGGLPDDWTWEYNRRVQDERKRALEAERVYQSRVNEEAEILAQEDARRRQLKELKELNDARIILEREQQEINRLREENEKIQRELQLYKHETSQLDQLKQEMKQRAERVQAQALYRERIKRQADEENEMIDIMLMLMSEI